jgi:hypothetical protein
VAVVGAAVPAEQAAAPQANAQAQTPAQAPAFKPEELEQIVAPIALYPDSLLAQIFMASTYPLEIVGRRALAEGASGRQRRCGLEGRRERNLGREREIAGRVSRRADDDEREARTGRRSSATPSSRNRRR